MAIVIAKTADLSATTNVVIHTAPAAKITTGNVRFVNRTISSVKIRLAISKTDVPTNAEYLEYDFVLGANDVLEDTGLVIAPDERVCVYSDTSGVSVRFYGIEEDQ